MKISEAQMIASLTGGTTTKRAEAIATELRSANLLPKGGRGPYAPEASNEEIALYLLAVAGAERVADAVASANDLASIQDAEGRTLLDIVAKALASPAHASCIRNIRVLAHVPMAEVTYREAGNHDRCARLFAKEQWGTTGFNPEAQAQGFVGRIGHIGGAALLQAAMMIAEPDDAGELVG